jgi:hypothetical protein
MLIEEGTDEGRDCYIVRTESATYRYQKEAGGFSSLHDRDGRDWINFKATPYGYPGDSGGMFRGIPNAVFPENIGHPGHGNMASERSGPATIRSWTADRAWEWTWTFSDTGARWDVLTTPADKAYWFLYEGTPAGRWAPGECFWGSDACGRRDDAPDWHAADGPLATGAWRWAYFGRRGLTRVLFLHCLLREPPASMFSYLGATGEGLHAPDGMTVFGFGRAGKSAEACLRGPASFELRFLETDRHGEIVRAAAAGGGFR